MYEEYTCTFRKIKKISMKKTSADSINKLKSLNYFNLSSYRLIPKIILK